MPKKLHGKLQQKNYLVSRFFSFSWAKPVVIGFCEGKPVKTGFSAATGAWVAKLLFEQLSSSPQDLNNSFLFLNFFRFSEKSLPGVRWSACNDGYQVGPLPGVRFETSVDCKDLLSEDGVRTNLFRGERRGVAPCNKTRSVLKRLQDCGDRWIQTQWGSE